MRVVHVLGGLEIGGKERVVLELARRAIGEGWEAELVLFDQPFRSVELDLDPGDLRVHFVPRRPGLDVRFPRALARVLRERSARVAHLHNDTAVFYGSIAARLVRPTRPAVVGTFHTRPPPTARGGRVLTRWASLLADRLTSVSDELAARLVDEGWVRRCETLWNGVDLDAFAPVGPDDGCWRERLGVPADAVLVGHVGRFDPVKRQVDLIDAVGRLAGPEPDVHLALVGRGPTLGDVRARALGRADVHFVASTKYVAGFLRAVDVLVLCSDHEAAPCILLEAMACARPIVATAVGAVPAIAGECARLVPARDPARLADAIAELAADGALRASLGRAARARAEAWSMRRRWAPYAELYRELASGTGPGSGGP